MRDTVEFKQDAAGLHPRNPEFRRTLARAHADLGRLRRDGHIGEDADPQAALPLDVTGDRTARGLDLPGGAPLRLHRLQPHRTEAQRGAALGVAVARSEERRVGQAWVSTCRY